MKLFKIDRPTVVRVDIFVKGHCKTFTLDERDAEKVRDELKRILSREFTIKINPLNPLPKVGIQCYEHTGSAKGKHKTFTSYGLTVERIYSIFMENIETDS
jgi:hypothetical protein